MIRVGAIEKALARSMKALRDDIVDPEGRIMIIDAKPAFLQAFFSFFRNRLSKPQFAHLWSLLLAWVANVQRSAVLHLAGLVHLMLTHHGLEAVGAQAGKANREVALPSLSRRLDDLRAALRRDQLERMLRHEHDPRLRRKLENYLMAA